MELLRELYNIVVQPTKPKRKPKKKVMAALPSFVAGNTVLSSDGGELSEANKPAPIKLDALPVRNKALNDALKSKRGGKHYDARADYVRAKEKHKTQRNDHE